MLTLVYTFLLCLSVSPDGQLVPAQSDSLLSCGLLSQHDLSFSSPDGQLVPGESDLLLSSQQLLSPHDTPLSFEVLEPDEEAENNGKFN